MPEYPIVDAHVHFYDPALIDYPWLDTVPAIAGPHLPSDLDAARGQVVVDRLVFVEVDAAAGRAHDEAMFVADLGKTDRRIAGIVASAALERGAAADREIATLMEVPGLRGIRRLIQHHPEADWCLNPGFVEGVRLVGKHGLTFDICIRNHQLASATELVRRCPSVRFVLDHIGKPSIAAGGWEPWASDLRAMAALPNVVCKVAGVATEADHAAWTPDQLRPYVEHAIDCFGLSRLLFASDWPVMDLATTYQQWVALMDDILAGADEGERRGFFRDNAIRAYRLDEIPR